MGKQHKGIFGKSVLSGWLDEVTEFPGTDYAPLVSHIETNGLPKKNVPLFLVEEDSNKPGEPPQKSLIGKGEYVVDGSTVHFSSSVDSGKITASSIKIPNVEISAEQIKVFKSALEQATLSISEMKNKFSILAEQITYPVIKKPENFVKYADADVDYVEMLYKSFEVKMTPRRPDTESAIWDE